MTDINKGIVALRINKRMSAAAAEGYYVGLLEAAKLVAYYEHMSGPVWFGEGCRKLGLQGTVTAEEFALLVRNYTPDGASRLTKFTRAGRRVGFDINYHPPKSVSIVALVLRDYRLIKAFSSAVVATLKRMERSVQCRVRTNNRDEDRLSQNMICALFPDLFSRPVEGNVSPHVHGHVFAVNATWDEEGGKAGIWKALQLGLVIENAPVFQAFFYIELAKRVTELGYCLAWEDNRWEIEGVSPEVIRLFSPRSTEIEHEIEDRQIWSDREKAEVAEHTRGKKLSVETLEALTIGWQNDLGPERLASLTALKEAAERRAIVPGTLRMDGINALGALSKATANLRERMSTWTEREFRTEALLVGRGAITLDEIDATLLGSTPHAGVLCMRAEGALFYTTPAIIQDVRICCAITTTGKGRFDALGGNFQLPTKLTADQCQAIRAMEKSKDLVHILRGNGTAAWEMLDAVRGPLGATREMIVLGTRVSCVRLLEQKKVDNVQDAHAFLMSSPIVAKGALVWVHDAGFLPAQAMRTLLEIAETQEARVVLVDGDTYRTSINRGSTLRFLADPGRLLGHDRLENPDIAERESAPPPTVGDDQTGMSAATKKYVGLLRAGASCEALADDSQVNAWTDEIRTEAKAAGYLRPVLSAAHEVQVALPEAKSSMNGILRAGDIIEIQGSPKSGCVGDRLTVLSTDSGVVVQGKAPGPFAFDSTDAHFRILRSLPIAMNDRLRVTRSAFVKGHSFLEGEVLRVRERLANGDLRVGKKRALPHDFMHLEYGWVISPHTVDKLDVKHVVALTTRLSPPEMPAVSKFCYRWAFSKKHGLFVQEDHMMPHASPLRHFLDLVLTNRAPSGQEVWEWAVAADEQVFPLATADDSAYVASIDPKQRDFFAQLETPLSTPQLADTIDPLGDLFGGWYRESRTLAAVPEAKRPIAAIPIPKPVAPPILTAKKEVTPEASKIEKTPERAPSTTPLDHTLIAPKAASIPIPTSIPKRPNAAEYVKNGAWDYLIWLEGSKPDSRALVCTLTQVRNMIMNGTLTPNARAKEAKSGKQALAFHHFELIEIFIEKRNIDLAARTTAPDSGVPVLPPLPSKSSNDVTSPATEVPKPRPLPRPGGDDCLNL